MTEFAGFSEAAQLYARYAAVVKAMKDAFDKSVNEFLDFLTDQIRQEAQSARLQETHSDTARNWWLADDAITMDDHPRLSVDPRSPRIIDPGELTLFAIAPRATGEQLRRLADVASDPRFRAFCTKGRGGPWSLFTATLKCAEPEKSAEEVAHLIASMLRVLDEIAQAPGMTQAMLVDRPKE